LRFPISEVPLYMLDLVHVRGLEAGDHKNNNLAEMWSGSEEGSYLKLIDL